jgi:chromate transporter
VGVIASLGVFFAVHTLFARSFNATWGPLSVLVPEPASVQVPALAVTVLACVLIFAARWSVLRTLGVCAVSGVLVQLVLTA